MRKSYRVKKESEFQRVFETHNSVANHKDWERGSPELGKAADSAKPARSQAAVAVGC